MCDPILIASIAAQGAGVAMQNKAVQDANRGQAMLMRDTQMRNRGLEDQQRSAIQDATSVAGADAGKAGMANAAADLAAILQGAITNRGGAGNSATVRSAPKVVQDMQDAAIAQAQAKAAQNAKAVAALDATGQYLASTVAPKISDSQAIGGMMGNFMRGNSAVADTGLRYEGSKAYSPTAQLLTGLGQVGTAYGLKAPTAKTPADPKIVQP
jgi:hypothetical protein